MISLRRFGPLTLACLGLLVLVDRAPAQPGIYGQPYGNPYQQPTLSPYLNLARPGNAAANYFLLVRPGFQQRAVNAQVGSAIQDLERRTAANSEATAEELLPNLPSTGHAAAFQNYGGYFGPTSTLRPGAQNSYAAPYRRPR